MQRLSYFHTVTPLLSHDGAKIECVVKEKKHYDVNFVIKRKSNIQFVNKNMIEGNVVYRVLFIR